MIYMRRDDCRWIGNTFEGDFVRMNKIVKERIVCFFFFFFSKIRSNLKIGKLLDNI